MIRYLLANIPDSKMNTLVCWVLVLALCGTLQATASHKGKLQTLHRLMKRQATAKVRILNRNNPDIPDISSPPSSGQSAYVYSQPASPRHQGITSDGSTSYRPTADKTSSRGRSASNPSTSGTVRISQTYSYPFGRERTQYVYDKPSPRNRPLASDDAPGWTTDRSGRSGAIERGGQRNNRRVNDGRNDQSQERSQAERQRGSDSETESQRGSTVETRDVPRLGPPSEHTRREDIASDQQPLSREEEIKRRLEERAIRLRQREEALRRRQELEEQRRRQIEEDELKQKEEEDQRRRQREEEVKRRQVAEEERRRRIEEIEKQRRRQPEESEAGAGQDSEDERRRQDDERRRRYHAQQRARQQQQYATSSINRVPPSTTSPYSDNDRGSQTTDRRPPQRPDVNAGVRSGNNQASPQLTRYSLNYQGSRTAGTPGQSVYIPNNSQQPRFGTSSIYQQGSQVYPNQQPGSNQYYQQQSGARIVSGNRGAYPGFRTRYETDSQGQGQYSTGNDWSVYPAVDQSGSSECPETGLDIRINGLDCQNAIRSYGTYLCYSHEYTSRQCCQVCLPKKQPSRVGCEYGDHTELCSTITPSDCYDLRNKHSCCDTCEKFRRTNVPAGCEYGDMTPRCDNVRQNPGLCYIPDNQRLCCDTCSQIKNTSNLSCAWGDYNPSLCQIYDENSSSLRLNCYAPQRRRLCCESCERLREWVSKDMPADCQYGDRPVAFNTGQYGRLNCTSLFTFFSIDECRTNNAVATNCCYTCNRLLTSRG